MRYILHFGRKSLRFTRYVTFPAHLNSEAKFALEVLDLYLEFIKLNI